MSPPSGTQGDYGMARAERVAIQDAALRCLVGDTASCEKQRELVRKTWVVTRVKFDERWSEHLGAVQLGLANLECVARVDLVATTTTPRPGSRFA